MSKYITEAIRSIALVGHGAAGKTTLAEAMLHAAGTIESKGSVEKGSTVCDFDPQEKEAGHSLTSAVTNFAYEDAHIHLLDTPGYPDFVGQANAAMAAAMARFAAQASIASTCPTESTRNMDRSAGRSAFLPVTLSVKTRSTSTPCSRRSRGSRSRRY